MAYPDFYGATGKNKKPLQPRGAQQQGYNLGAGLASGAAALGRGVNNMLTPQPQPSVRTLPASSAIGTKPGKAQPQKLPFMTQLAQDYQKFNQGTPSLEQQLSQRQHSTILENPPPPQAPMPSFEMPQPTGKLADQIQSARQQALDPNTVIANSPTIQSLRSLRAQSDARTQMLQQQRMGSRTHDPGLGVVESPADFQVQNPSDFGAASSRPFQQRAMRQSLPDLLSQPGAVSTPSGMRVHSMAPPSGIPSSNRFGDGGDIVSRDSAGRTFFVDTTPAGEVDPDRLAYARARQQEREVARGKSPSGAPTGPMSTPEMVAANNVYRQNVAPSDPNPLFSDVRSNVTQPSGIDVASALVRPASLTTPTSPTGSTLPPAVAENRQRREEELAQRNALVQQNAAARAAARRGRLEARNQPPNLVSMLAMRNPRFALEMARLNQQGQIAQMENALRRELGMADVDVRREGVDVQRQGLANQHELGMGGLDLRREGLQQEGDLARQRLQQEDSQFQAAQRQRNLDQMASGFLDPEMSSEVQASLFDQWNQERRPGGVDLQGALSDPSLAAPQANPFRSGVRGVDQIPEGADLSTMVDSMLMSNPEVTPENRERLLQSLMQRGITTDDLIAHLEEIDPSRHGSWGRTMNFQMPEHHGIGNWLGRQFFGEEAPEETSIRQRRLAWLKSLLASGE